MKRIVSITALLLFPVLGFAACPDVTNSAGYVRAGATGSATGADWTNAFTSLPASLVRGCTYYVAVGTYGTHNFNDADSGATTITIQAPTIASHGTSTGWSNTYVGQALFQCSTTCTNLITFTTDYYIVSGSYCTAISGLPICNSGYGMKFDNSNGNASNAVVAGGGDFNWHSHDITLKYIDEHGCNPDLGETCQISISNLAYVNDFEDGAYDLLFDHVYAHDGYTAFFIKGCLPTGGATGACPANAHAEFGTGQNITIQYSYIYHVFDSPDNVYALHGEACSCSQGVGNLTIRYNIFNDIANSSGGTAITATAAGSAYNAGNSGNGPWYIYGNILMCDTAANCSAGQNDTALFDVAFNGGGLYYYNNTVANLGNEFNGNTGFGCGQNYGGTGQTELLTTTEVRNNIFYRCSPMAILTNGSTTGCSGAGTCTMTTPATWSYNALFNTVHTGDSNPNEQFSSADPFTNDTTPQGMTLVSDTSPMQAISNFGTYWNGTSSVTNTFTVDMNGVTRTTSRGALQFGGASDPPDSLSGATISGAVVQ